MGKKIKGGVLLYALVISTFTSLLIVTLLWNFELSTKQNIKLYESLNNLTDARSGISWLMNESILPEYRIDELISLKKGSNLKFKKERWGLYNFVQCSTAQGEVSLSALTGIFPHKEKIPTFYLTDKSKPLTLVGDIKLTGKFTLPISGFRLASIERISPKPQFKNFITDTSTLKLPDISQDLKSYLKSLVKLINNIEQKQFIPKVEDSDSLIVSFNSTPHLIIEKEELVLNTKFYKGNIIVCSKKKIILGSNLTLEDVIIIAPEIEVNAGFKGKVHLVSSSSIRTSSDCEFLYPSSIIAFGTDSVSLSINLGKNNKLQGGILLYPVTANDGTSILKSEKDCSIVGTIACFGVSEIHGQVSGPYFTENVEFTTSTSKYANYMTDIYFYPENINRHFLLPAIWDQKSQSSILKWL